MKQGLAALTLMSLAACFGPTHHFKTGAPSRPSLGAAERNAGSLHDGPRSRHDAVPQDAGSHAALPPLQADPRWVELPLPRGHPAVLSLPRGATTPRPVVVAAHGAGDRPDWYCQVWDRIVAQRAFVLCPRGYPIDARRSAGDAGYFYDGHPLLGREIARALSALQARYGDYVDVRRPLFVGYSQGANMGSLMLPSHPAKFAAAIFVEGGVGEFREWNVRAARRFWQRGARRVLMLCGRESCAGFARTTAHYMRLGGLEVRVVYARGAGHTYGGAVAKAAADNLSWLLAGDPRW